MNYEKRIQKYQNFATVADAMKAGFDLVQPKYDGWWARVVIKDGTASIYSRQGMLKHTKPVPQGTVDMVLVGEYLIGTQRATSGADSGNCGVVRVFDVLEIEGTNIAESEQYEWRMAAGAIAASGVEWLVATRSEPAGAARKLWDEYVERDGAEGLVFRRSTDAYSSAIIGRVKKQFTMDYVVMSVVEGEGKHAGRAGAVVCGMYVRGTLTEKVRVGGGWTDAMREAIWAEPSLYVGQVLEVKGFQVFESGSMRHPNAVRFRNDKTAAECVWTSSK